jgi:hypothetical protein
MHGDVPLLPKQPGEAPPEAPPRLRDTLIVLRPLPSDVPADHRLRQLLKLALRRFRMRCLRCEDLPGE